MKDLGYHDLAATLKQRFGLEFTYSQASRANALIWETRLDDGNWLWISDYDASLHPLTKRQALEGEGITIGWHIGIYANIPENGADGTDGCTQLASVAHYRATTDELPDLIDLAMSSRARNEQHRFTDAVTHQITYGIQQF